jgi:AI-2 transport protein TqsA
MAEMPPPGEAPKRPDTTNLVTVAICLVIAATSWYLLQQLAALLRPLLLAVFLAYIILPIHHRLTRHLPRAVSFLVMAAVSLGAVYGLSLIIYASVLEFNEELSRYIDTGQAVYAEASHWWNAHFAWLRHDVPEGAKSSPIEGQQIRAVGSWAVGMARDTVTEAVVVGFYLLFLLLEVHRYPLRVQSAFGGPRANNILIVAKRVNDSIANYLKAKVQASALLAAPVTLVLWVCQIKFCLLWGALTFLCNFIPYLGSIIAVTLPLAFALLDLYPRWDWRIYGAVGGVLATHLVMTYLVEPTITSRAVGLSPLVILFSLAFWGQCWGLLGMFLAIPLTVMLKIVLANVEFTRPFAELLGDR